MISDKFHFSMVRNFSLADFITLMNGICGIQSILSSMRHLVTNSNQDLYMAMFFMFLGMVLDILDGKVARLRNTISLIGQELDSLADLISFGVAPVTLAYAVGLHTFLDTVAFSYFICCGIARLARYNASVAISPKDTTGKIQYFEGTPIPTSLILVACIAYGMYRDIYLKTAIVLIDGWEMHPFVLLFILSGTLMISKTLRIPKL